MIRWSTAGESHGPALVALIEGIPAGVQVTSADVEAALARRRQGYGRGSRQQFEQDALRVLAGVRHGITLGSPIALEIANSEWPKWETVMSADPVDRSALLIDAGTGDEREVARNKRLTRPRPGHADLVGTQKYGHTDARNVLERASARETAARVALGEIARQFLRQAFGVEIGSHVVGVGTVSVPCDAHGLQLSTLRPRDLVRVEQSPVRTADPALEAQFIAEIDSAKEAGDTLGGVAEVVAWNVPPGLGTYAVDRERLDARIAAAMMSIQAVKGVEIGAGFSVAAARGSRAHDEVFASTHGYPQRFTNRAGGIEGGMSNGEPIVVRFALKPISTVPHALQTIDLDTRDEVRALHQRSDTTAVVPAAVIGEAMLALTLAEAAVEKFGGDTIEEVRSNAESWLATTVFNPRLPSSVREEDLEFLSDAQDSHSPWGEER